MNRYFIITKEIDVENDCIDGYYIYSQTRLLDIVWEKNRNVVRWNFIKKHELEMSDIQSVISIPDHFTLSDAFAYYDKIHNRIGV